MAAFDFLFFVFFCLAIFVFDVLQRRVPNWLVLLSLAVRILVLTFSTSADWQAAFAGAVVAFVVFLPFYMFRAMGAGDVKYFVAVGFWLGPAALLVVWVGGSLIAGLHALASVLGSRSTTLLAAQMSGFRLIASLRQSLNVQRLREWLRNQRAGRHGIPYAAYMAVAAVVYAAERVAG